MIHFDSHTDTGGRGFGAHAHRDMEILSYVLEGQLAHKDSMGHGEVLGPNEIQVMSAGTGVVQSVYVQANWAKTAFEDEVAYVQKAADETGFPQGIVGYADFLADDIRPQLDRLTKYRGMRGLRMQLHWHENPQYRSTCKCLPAR